MAINYIPLSLCLTSNLPVQVEPAIPQSLLSETDIIRSCCFVKGNIKLLTGIIGVSDPELADLKQSYSRKDICALGLIEVDGCKRIHKKTKMTYISYYKMRQQEG